MNNLLDFTRQLIPVVRAAGEIELKYYHEGFDVMDKADGSPVTLADQQAEDLIIERLKALAPQIPMVGEESAAKGIIPDVAAGTFFLVDPLDGTREFITGGGGFTVNIALLKDFIPVAGIIYAPVADELYFGAEGHVFSVIKGIEKKETARTIPEEGLTLAVSKFHGSGDRLEEFMQGKKIVETIRRSSSLKFCALASGKADIYPRFAPTMEWDTAAGDAILQAAGGYITTLDGKILTYGKTERNFRNPDFIAFAAR